MHEPAATRTACDCTAESAESTTNVAKNCNPQDGEISAEELSQSLQKRFTKATSRIMVENLMSIADLDHSGTIDEVCLWAQCLVPRCLLAEKLGIHKGSQICFG